jgi:iron complex transport system substrate-binding protein
MKSALKSILLAALVLIAAVSLWRRQRVPQAPAQPKKRPPPIATTAPERQPVLNSKPQRIISLAPSATEMLFAIGAGDRVIADTSYCNYPPAAAALPKIGGYLDANPEQLLALKPDLIVVVRGNRAEILRQLQGFNIPMLATETDSIEEVQQTIQQLGKAAGEEAKAQQLISDMEARLRYIRDKVEKLPEEQRPRVLFLFSLNRLCTAGPGSHIDELIRLAGGKNIAAQCDSAWPELSMETVVAGNPEVILVVDTHGSERGLTQERALATLRANPLWQHISAVQKGRVIVLPDDPVTIPGPRMITGLELIYKALHDN